MLQIDGIDVAIGSVSILREVSLAVARGQFAGLIGRNGAGKTTLLRTVMSEAAASAPKVLVSPSVSSTTAIRMPAASA